MTVLIIPVGAILVAIFLLLLFYAHDSGLNYGFKVGRETRDELKKTIDQLTTQLKEALEMARKPLTEVQLKTCFEAHGNECPRCGSDEISVSDLESSDDDSSLVCQTATCDDCQEQWNLYFKLEKVESYEE